MDVHNTPVNPYHPANRHQQYSHPQQTIPQPGYPPQFNPFQQYYTPAASAQGLNAPYATSAAASYNAVTAAPPVNALRYAPPTQQHFNLPVHNGLPIQRRPTQPQLSQVPPQPKIAHVEPVSTAQNGNVKVDKHLKGLRCIPEPPDKELWRQRLFDVDGFMILTEDQYAVLSYSQCIQGC